MPNVRGWQAVAMLKESEAAFRKHKDPALVAHIMQPQLPWHAACHCQAERCCEIPLGSIFGKVFLGPKSVFKTSGSGLGHPGIRKGIKESNGSNIPHTPETLQIVVILVTEHA